MRIRRLAVCLALWGGCFQNVSPPEGLIVAATTPTHFDATFTRNAQWVRVEVRYTASTTFYGVTTSFGTTLAHQGTEPAPASFAPDLRMDATEGFVVLNRNDAEYDLVQAMLDAMIARGQTATPTVAQKATTEYAGAYTLAEVLGLVMLPEPGYFHAVHGGGYADGTGGMRDDGPRQIWPAPGYDVAADLPAELVGGGCCGPLNCTTTMTMTSPCDAWCAAGDHCIASHSNRGCGAITPVAGVCASSNSQYLASYAKTDPTKYLKRHSWH